MCQKKYGSYLVLGDFTSDSLIRKILSARSPDYVLKLAQVAPKLNESIIKDMSRFHYEYMEGNIKQSKALTVNRLAQSKSDLGAIVNQHIALGIHKGAGEKEIIKNAFNVIGNNLDKLKPAVARHVHHTLSVIYNESSVQSVYELCQTPGNEGLGLQWISRLEHSTPICLGLPGKTIQAGEQFKWGGWQGVRPPAVGIGAKPIWHVCYSTVVPYDPDWPEDPEITRQVESIKNGEISAETGIKEASRIGNSKTLPQNVTKKAFSNKTKEFINKTPKKELEARVNKAQNLKISNKILNNKVKQHEKHWEQVKNYVPGDNKASEIVKDTLLNPDKIFIEVDIPTVFRDFNSGKISAKLENIFQDKYINYKFLKDDIFVAVRNNKIQSFYPVSDTNKMLKSLTHAIEVTL